MCVCVTTDPFDVLLNGLQVKLAHVVAAVAGADDLVASMTSNPKNRLQQLENCGKVVVYHSCRRSDSAANTPAGHDE